MKRLHFTPVFLLCAATAFPQDRGAAAVNAFVAEPTSLRKLLESRQYDKLESALAAIDTATRGKYDQENVRWAAYNYLAQPRPANEKLFDEWRATGSTRARLARAMFLEKRGWRARGGSYASETSPSQFTRMEDFHAEAEREYLAVLEKDPGEIQALSGLMSRCLNRGGAECSRKLLARALAKEPGSFNIRAEHMYSLKPRWGGSYEAMSAFANEAQKQVHLNPRLKHLLGFADAERAFSASLQKKYPEAIQFATEALKHGPEPVYLAERAAAYRSAMQPDKALEDIRAARTLSPAGWFFSEIRLAHTYAIEAAIAGQKGDTAAAGTLLARAGEIEIDDEYINGWVEVLRRVTAPR